jgi:hypothetical protein
MSTGKSESVGLRSAPESTLGINPTTGWVTLNPDQAGIADFYAKITTVAPSPMSPSRQLEAPEVVDIDAAPKLTMDLTMDHLYAFREGIMMVNVKHAGGTGVSRFFPTARTTTAFTVAAGGALQAGTLVIPRGFIVGTNVAQNGTPLVVGAAATGTSITVAGGAAETVSGYAATLEVVGFRGAASDITIDSSSNITSTIADFTTMGLVAGMVIWVGGTIGGGHDFIAQPTYRGFVKLVTVAAHLLTTSAVTRQWTVGAADPGTGQTIDLYWTSWMREVAFDDAAYPSPEPSYAMEMAVPGIGAANATVYCYAQGQSVDQFKITAALKSLVKAELMFSGTFVTQPSVTRLTGPSTAQAVFLRSRFTTVAAKELYLRFTDGTTGALISNKVSSWSLTHKNGVSPLKQQGFTGTFENIIGKAEVAVDAELYINSVDPINVGPANTTVAFGAGFRNADGGVFFDVPSMKFTDSPMTFPANGPIMLSAKTAGFRDAIGNYTMGMSMFGYLPAA